MKIETKDYKSLKHGLYVVFWNTGGSSLASVGSDRTGEKWFAPTNWINMDKSYLKDHIESISFLVLLTTNN